MRYLFSRIYTELSVSHPTRSSQLFPLPLTLNYKIDRVSRVLAYVLSDLLATGHGLVAYAYDSVICLQSCLLSRRISSNARNNYWHIAIVRLKPYDANSLSIVNNLFG